MRVSQTLTLAIVCATALTISSCTADTGDTGGDPTADAGCGPLEEMTTVTLAVNPGAQDLVTQTIKSQGFDADYNLNLDIKSFQSPPESATAVTQGAVDIGFGGVTTMAQARANGADVFMFGALASPSNGVFTTKDSDIDDIGDLAGARFGSFSANNSATFVVLSAIASEGFGMDKLEDELASLAVAPDAAVLGLLDAGELDAVLLGSTATVVTQLTDDYKQIGDLSAEYVDATGIVPVHLALASTDAYAVDHCSELVAFSNAMRDAVEYVQSDEQAWIDYADTLQLTDPDAPEALQALLGENFRTEWDEAQVEGMTTMLESFIPILGETDFISEVPDGLFRSEFVATDG